MIRIGGNVCFLLVSLFFVASLSAQAGTATSLARIQITRFRLLFPTDDSFKVVVTAKAEGITIGSFGLRTAHRWGKERGNLPGFKVGADGFARPERSDIFAGDFDNGSFDEDLREGTFARTFSARGWGPGNYELLLAAHNRPAPGAYISDRHSINFTISGEGKIVPFQPPTDLVNIQGTDVIIFKEQDAYACFPSLTKLDDGRLVTSFGARITRAHIDPRGVSKTMISNDGGLTWREALKEEKPFINPAWRTSDGRLVKVSAEGWRYVKASQRERLQQEERYIMDAFPGTIAYLSPKYVVQISRDRGISWQKQSILAPDYVRGLMFHLEASSNLVTSDGLRLLAIYGKRRGSGIDEVFILRSADEGKSWTFISLLPEGPQEMGWNESALTETADGRILIMMRSAPEGYLWQSFSEDGGLTWSNPGKTPMWGHPPHLLTLPDGRILCTYGYRRTPLGIRASLSADNGKTWQVNREFILRADGLGHAGDLGYPITKLLADGSLFTIYYLTLADNITHIAGSKWRID